MKYAACIYVIICAVCSLAAAHGTYAQTLEKTISIQLRKATLNEALDEIASRAQVNIVFTGSRSRLEKTTLTAKNERLGDLLTRLLVPYQLTYVVVDNNIVVRKIAPPKARAATQRGQAVDDTIKVRGRVLDQKEPPTSLPGVSAVIKGTQKGVTTDADGFFEINCKAGDVLVFTMIGFASREYQVTGKERNLIISLPETANALSEVVVTGFSEQNVKYLASSVSKVAMNNVNNKPITQLSQALQGGTTGINVTQGSGLPGGDAAAIKIRGVGSLLGSDPLVLVDGVPFDMNKLDPNTIESISILKDAAAASVYGARAGNGVILVTTKRGVAGKVDVQYNVFFGTQKPMVRPDFVDAPTYMEMVNEARRNTGGAPTYTDEVITATQNRTDPLRYPDTNWGDLLIHRRAPIQQHGLTVSGGNAAARFSLAANYLKQDGLIPLSGFSRGNVRANTSVDLSKNVVVFMDLFASRDEQLQPYAYGGHSRRLLEWIYSAPPNVMSRYPEKPERPGFAYYGTYGESWNPLAQVEVGGTSKWIRDEVLINLRPKWEITPDLSVKGQFSYRVSSGADKHSREAFVFFDYFTDEKAGWDYGTVKNSFASERSSYYYAGGNLDYTKNLGDHRINIIAGYSQELNSASNWNETSLVSAFGKIYYSYNDRYLLEAGMRKDGSSLFAPGHKWGNFPSVAVGWNVVNESFMKGLKFIDQFKIRGSYGMLGNNNIPRYAYQTTINTGNGTEVVIGNPNITWEKVGILDIGADISLLERQIDLTFDWYDKETTDLILSPQPTLTSGLSTGPVNIGSVRNRGWEIKLGYNKVVSPNAEFSLNLGYSYNRSKWLKLSQERPIVDGDVIRRKGGAVGEFYGYKSQGLLQQADIDAGVPVIAGQEAGDIRYVDTNNDGAINNDDRIPLGAQDPFGIYFGNLSFKIGNFDAEILTTGNGNVPVFYRGRIAVPLNVSGEGGTPQNWHKDYWTESNTQARLPRLLPSPGNNGLMSDFWKVNGAFLRVKYIQLGYNLPQSWCERIKIRGIRLYLNAQNPFTFTEVELIDPETKGDHGTYPMFKTNTVGLNVRF